MSGRASLPDAWNTGQGSECLSFAAISDVRRPQLILAGKLAAQEVVIDQAGPQRRSDVRFMVLPVPDLDALELARRALIEDKIPNAGLGWTEGLDQCYLEYLRASLPHGALIIAACVVAQIPSRIGLS